MGLTNKGNVKFEKHEIDWFIQQKAKVFSVSIKKRD